MPNENMKEMSSVDFLRSLGSSVNLPGNEPQTPRSAAIGKEIKMALPLTDPLASPELFGRDLLERGGNVPIPGRDIMEDLMAVEIGENGDTAELEIVLRKAWAYREGLPHGATGDAYRFHAEQVSANEATKDKVAKIQNLFYTVEGATERPRADYVDIAIEDALDRRIRVAQEYRDNPEAYRAKITRQLTKKYGPSLNHEQVGKVVNDQIQALSRDYLAIPQLVKLSNHSKVRASFDHAFRQRMVTCEDPGKAAKLGSADMPTQTPDGQHWAALFNGEGGYGEKVDGVFEEMVKVALPVEVIIRLGMTPIPPVRDQVPENVYSVGFDNTRMFATWMEHMLKKADGRMDIVWQAWKLMLTFEVADDLGQSVNKKGKYALASPPIGNPLMTYLAHWKEKTSTEFGEKADGSRSQVEKFVEHSGLPLTIGHIPNLCEQYFIEAKVGFDKSYLGKPWMTRLLDNALKNLPKQGDKDYDSECFTRQRYFNKLKDDMKAFRDGTANSKGDHVKKIDISLWDIWLYGRIGFADKEFPWFATDQATIDPATGELPTSGELPAGSVGMWYLTRGRSWGERGGVANDLKSLPALNEMSDPKFFPDRVRTWAKVLGTIGEDVEPSDSPRTWWVAAIINLHLSSRETAFLKNIPNEIKDVNFVYTQANQNISPGGAGSSSKEDRGISIGDFLQNATLCGFLRKKDCVWIFNTLGTTSLPKWLS